MVVLFVYYTFTMVIERGVMRQIDAFLNTQEAIVLTGMRRTGKTTLLRYYYERLQTDNKIFVDFENILNRKYFQETNYEAIRRHLEFLGLDFSRNAFVFIDEIQFVSNLPSVVKYLIDHYRVKFFLTGSASFYLKGLFAESLAGRKVLFEIFPLTFREFLAFKGKRFQLPEDPFPISDEIYETLMPLYDEYMYYGGFPGVVLNSSVKEKKKALEDILTSYFQFEVMQFSDFRKNDSLRDLILLLMQSIGSKIDILRLSRDIGISRHTVHDYLAFLEGTYLISTIKPFSRGRGTEIRKSPKVYFCDSGLINHFARLDEGHIFENTVYQNLRTMGNLHYYQRKSGVEIDFILNRETAYEVKLSADINDLRRLRALAKDLGLKGYYLVSKKKSKQQSEGVLYGFMVDS
jgi:predicted AAA+ superfamily ATPase